MDSSNAPEKLARHSYAFIDRPNIDRTTKDLLNFSIDWSLLYEHLHGTKRHWQCEKVFMYTGAKETAVANTIANLTKIGYEARVRSSKPQKDRVREHAYTCKNCQHTDKITVVYHGSLKSNCDVDLTVDAMQCINAAKEILLFTGDGDFESLIIYAMDRGVHVRIISNTGRDRKGDKKFSRRLQNILDEEIISGDRRASFIDINDWKQSIQRKPPSSVAAPDRT
jgi:uncharacterized LabA/DUF88 family protein